MNYQRIYDELIQRGLERSWNRNTAECYVERHRIVPGCLGGEYVEGNYVFLTAREHYISHWLLYKIYKTSALAFAWFAMCKGSPNQQRQFNSRYYDNARSALSKSQRGKVGTFKGKKHKPETIEKLKAIIKTPEQIMKIRRKLSKLTDEQIDFLLQKKEWKRGEKTQLAREWGCNLDQITRWVGKSFTHNKE